MTINIAYADAGDGYAYSYSTSWDTARLGAAAVGVNTADVTGRAGEAYYTGIYYVYQLFTSFTYTPPSGETITSATIRFFVTGAYAPSTYRRLQTQEYDWGATLTTADWVTNWGVLTSMAIYENGQAAGGKYITAGGDRLISRIATGSSPLRLVTRTDNTSASITPTQQQDIFFSTADESGTTFDPALVWLTIPSHTHQHCGGGQVRLSDGSWVYLVSDGAAVPTMTLRYRTSGGVTSDIGNLPFGSSASDFAYPGGYQTLALVRDASDNLFVLGPNGAATGSLSVRPYTKSIGGATWTAGTMRTGALPSYLDGGINAVAAGWHNVGTGGTIMALATHTAGRWALSGYTDAAYALIDCNYLLTGAGTGLLRASGNAVGTLVPYATTGEVIPTNEAGSGIDVQVPTTATTRGYAFSWYGNCDPGESIAQYPSRYTLASDGASFSSTSIMGDFSQWSTKDATAKIRVLAISDTVMALITMDADDGWGPTITLLQNVGTSSTWTRLARVTLDGLGLATLPPAATMAVSSAWDAAYDTADNKIWIYHVDTANARRLVRTSINLNTYLPTLDTVEITSTMGTGAASICRSVRVERSARAGNSYILVTCAIDTSGVQSSDFYIDAFNQAPNSPTLTTMPNFDATSASTFSWTFSDPNAGDTQSRFELDINTSAGADVYDTGALGAGASYAGVGAASAAVNASVTPEMASGWAQGDLLLITAAIRNSGTGTVNTPTGWTKLVESGNLSLLGRIAKAGDTAPTVTFSNGVANADTAARMIALRGLDQSISTVMHSSAAQLNGSAQNVSTPALTITAPGCAALLIGWKQDDLTSIATPSGFTGSASWSGTAGDDMSLMHAYLIQSTSANLAANSFAITGGASAISRGIAVALRPYQTPTSAAFTLPANTLSNGSAYQWRVRTWDQLAAAGTWSDYLPFSCAAGGNVTITAPASDNPSGVITDDYLVSWSVSGTTQSSYRVSVARVDTGVSLLDTGWVTSTDTSYMITGMASDVQYRISVTVRNAALVESGTGTRLITASYATPEVPTLTATPVDDDGYVLLSVVNPASGTPPLSTSADGFESGIGAYSTTNCTFTASSAYASLGSWSARMTATSASVTAQVHPSTLVAITGGQRYTVSWQAYATSASTNIYDSIWWFDATSAEISAASGAASLGAGAWASRSYTATAPSNAAYAAPGVRIASPSASQVAYIDNLLLAVASDRPAPVGNQIHRTRADGTGVTVVVATETDVPADGTFRDYTAASGVEYAYRARAVALTGSSDSAWVTATQTLQGVWIHDPLDPQDTARQYRYGRSARTEAIDVPAKELQFAGRAYPIVEYGSAQDDTWTVKITIPHGPGWADDVSAVRDFAASRRTLYFRDNRGRAAYSSITGYRGDDRDEGTGVSLSVRRVDYIETTV